MKMCEALAREGHDVTLLCLGGKIGVTPEVFNQFGVKNIFRVHAIKSLSRYGSLWYYGFQCAVFLSRNRLKIDLIYSRFLLGTWMACFIHRRIIFEAHKDYSVSKLPYRYLYRRMVNDFAVEKVVVISEALRRVVMKHTRNRVVVAHDACNIPKISTTNPLQRNDAGLQVGYVGSFYPGKGMEIIEQIAPVLKDKVHIHIVGGSAEQIRFWQSRLPTSNITFYGYVEQSAVSSFIYNFDVCLLPNLRSVRTGTNADIGEFTSPLKMFEYMAHKKAIVASDIPVLREVLNEKNALLASPDKAGDWIAALEKLHDSSLRKQLGENAFKDFVAQYTWNIRAKKVLRG
jgi:glycosyltransferase involved in cell wall biosynthesis